MVYQAVRPLEVENYQVTMLLIDKLKPTYYVELGGERWDVAMVRSSEGKPRILLYEGLEVTGLKIAGSEEVYIYSGALSEDEVLYKVRCLLLAQPAAIESLVALFGGLAVLALYRHRA